MPLGNEGSGTVVATGGGYIAAGAGTQLCRNLLMFRLFGEVTAHPDFFWLEYCTWDERDVLRLYIFLYMFESGVNVFQR